MAPDQIGDALPNPTKHKQSISGSWVLTLGHAIELLKARSGRPRRILEDDR